jgi:hypothetical protein
MSPMGSFNHFVKNDPITNIDVWRDRKPNVDIQKEFPFMKNIQPAGTQTFIYQTGKVLDGKLNRNDLTIKENPRNKTDHVSYNPPTSGNPQQKVFEQMLVGPRYSQNHESSNDWVPHDAREYLDQLKNRNQKERNKLSHTEKKPSSKRSEIRTGHSMSTTLSVPGQISKTFNNRSCVKENIITGKPNIHSGQVIPMHTDTTIFNRKKGLGEFRDIQSKTNNVDYRKAYNRNTEVFKRQNGIFTHLYNAAARFGETEVFKA